MLLGGNRGSTRSRGGPGASPKRQLSPIRGRLEGLCGRKRGPASRLAIVLRELTPRNHEDHPGTAAAVQWDRGGIPPKRDGARNVLRCLVRYKHYRTHWYPVRTAVADCPAGWIGPLNIRTPSGNPPFGPPPPGVSWPPAGASLHRFPPLGEPSPPPPKSPQPGPAGHHVGPAIPMPPHHAVSGPAARGADRNDPRSMFRTPLIIDIRIASHPHEQTPALHPAFAGADVCRVSPDARGR
jgi:hypothetical protein